MKNFFKRKSLSLSTHSNPQTTPPPPTTDSTPSAEDVAFTQPLPKQVFKSPPRILIIGAGSRGTAYAEAARTCSNATIAAICEPIAYKRQAFGRKYIWGPEKASPGQEFDDWRAWADYERDRRSKQQNGETVDPGVDAVFVCVLDEMHEDVICGIAPLELHLCCEKPLSTSLESCLKIYRALKGVGVATPRKETIFGICHVLRYSPHNMLLRQLLLEKEVIGEVLSMEHVEPVGWWHFSHSYVRGNWRDSRKTGPSLLTKSCHDIDFILWLLCSPPSSTSTPTPPHLPSRITSTGSLSFFRNARKPRAAGPATNCLACPIEPTCMYSAKKIYLERHLQHGNANWPVNIVDPEIEDLYKAQGADVAQGKLLDALADDYTPDTPVADVRKRNWFGRCVWESDNDVCDEQFVTLTWDDDFPDDEPPAHPDVAAAATTPHLGHRAAKTATFHMTAFTEKQCERRGTINGTAGELTYDSRTIRVHDFATGQTTTHTPHMAGGGHGGGDEGLVRKFLGAVDAVRSGAADVKGAQREWLGCDVEEAFRSHAVVFAAEEGRVRGKVVEVGEWWKERVEGGLGG